MVDCCCSVDVFVPGCEGYCDAIRILKSDLGPCNLYPAPCCVHFPRFGTGIDFLCFDATKFCTKKFGSFFGLVLEDCQFELGLGTSTSVYRISFAVALDGAVLRDFEIVLVVPQSRELEFT